MASKTIVFYIATLTRGGAERVMVSLANSFAAMGDRVLLVTLEEDEGLYEIDDRVKHIVLDFAGEGRIKSALGRILKVRKLVRENKADALVGFIGKTNIRTILAGLGTGARTVVSVRSTPEREYKGTKNTLIAKLVFPFADGVVFQTERARDFFGEAVRKKSTILPNPLSFEYVGAYVPGQNSRDNTGIKRIVTVGRMDPVKNHRLLLEAFRLVAQKLDKISLTIYGDGECREDIAALTKKYNLEDRVNLPGDTKNIKEKIKDASLFVLSSDFEGMPNAIAEAQALGIPVVSTDCPNGARALVEHEKTGLLVPVGDCEKMAGAMERVLTDSSLADKLSEGGATFAKSLYPDEVHARWREFIYKN